MGAGLGRGRGHLCAGCTAPGPPAASTRTTGPPATLPTSPRAASPAGPGTLLALGDPVPSCRLVALAALSRQVLEAARTSRASTTWCGGQAAGDDLLAGREGR